MQNPSPQQNSAPSPPPAEHPPHLHPMVVLQPGERVIGELKRHPFGILMIYAGAVVGMGVIAALAFTVLPGVIDKSNDSSIMGQVYIGLGLLVTLFVVILGIATTVYWQNTWVITTDSITQVSQTSLFSRQVSQLSMDNLEDVTVDQNGILPHLFNFGTLKVESAGERSKFVFPYCPNPNRIARQILEVHESFLEERRNIRQVTASRPSIHTN